MKNVVVCLATTTVFISALVLPAKAERVCQVTDPTGTPLNVREQPNGKVVSTLKNGRDVYIKETAFDRPGRPWARVSSYSGGKQKYWGWVYREFISCYNR